MCIRDRFYRDSQICSRCAQVFSDVHRCFLRMFAGFFQDVLGCSDGSCGPYWIWWSFQMKVWTLMIQRNSMIPNYSMIPAIWSSPAIRWSLAIRWCPAIWWSIGSMDFDNPKVYGDTSITDGLVFVLHCCWHPWTRCYCFTSSWSSGNSRFWLLLLL